MRINTLGGCFFAAILLIGGARPMMAQQEVFHPGETYDSLQAGQDAYGDAEAQRRALIGRQLMIEEQLVRQNTWADPQAKYRPVRPESYGPILPKYYAGPTLADVYAYPPTDGGPVYYAGTPAVATVGPQVPSAAGESGRRPAAAGPVFQPWPRVPGDIWGTPYYGYVRQPIGHIKIWTSRLGYIYKPIYASPAMESPQQGRVMAVRMPPAAPVPPRPSAERGVGHTSHPAATDSFALPPPPKPADPPAAGGGIKLDRGPIPAPPMPHPPQAGQEF